MFPKEKNRKKRKPFKQGGQTEKPKGNGISPEGWQGNTTTRRSHLNFALPLCRSLLVGWCGGCPPYLCYLFILFLINSNQRKGAKNT
ncbi:hypothetical protein [Elizabethkingia anophelis]|uniref:hypothetical protein n=1 Tax=Elizabethkingia anophelis TaxID=1117645 RepID=UPI0016251CFB|nr:hypothetical protein [Elizabethkingia anophelis]